MSDSTNVPILFRPMIEEDKPFIFNSWLKSFRSGTMNRNVDNSIYFFNHHKIVDSLLQKCNVTVCCSSEDPSFLYGYIVYEQVEGQFVLHYIYVKNTYRKLGLAKKLLQTTGHDFNILGCYTHQTPLAVVREEQFNLLYHPYLLLSK